MNLHWIKIGCRILVTDTGSKFSRRNNMDGFYVGCLLNQISSVYKLIRGIFVLLSFSKCDPSVRRVTRETQRVYHINFALSFPTFALSFSFSRSNPLYRVNRLFSPPRRVPFRLLDSAGSDAPAESNVIIHKHTRAVAHIPETETLRIIAINAYDGGARGREKVKSAL